MGKHSAPTVLTISAAISMILAAAAAGAEETSPTNLGQVVVTAQKRAEKLQDIPMSVTVLSGEALERQSADNFRDLVAMVPGLSINSSTRGVTRLTLRGINTGGVASTVGVYVNDVPFGSSSGLANGAILSGDFDTFDVARIEVLRGPQGTLYGASSLGGVIKYVANTPSTAGFEARVQGSVEDVEGGDMGYAVTGVVNAAVSDTFAIRASGFYRDDGGFIDSIGNNPLPSLQNPLVNVVDGTRIESNLNGLSTWGGRVSALFQPSDQFSLNLTAMLQRIESDNSDLVDADPVTQTPLYGGLVASNYHPEFTNTDYQVYSATLDWDFGPATLQSVTSYGTFEEKFQRDYGGFPVQIGPGVFTTLTQFLTFLFSDPITAQPPFSALLNQITSTDKFTQEVRIVSPADQALEWLVGAYYTDEDSGIDPQNISAIVAGTETPVAGFPVLANARLNSKYQEMALFANATWHAAPRFQLSFGARYSENDQDASQVLDGILVGGLTTFDNAHSSESPFTYSVSPRFELSDNTAVYARVATGYRPGGPNVLPPGAPSGTPTSYDSDRLTSYEVGLKTESADGRFGLDAAAYYLDWQDIQLFAIINSVGVNANGGTATSQGFEFTATARPSAGWSLMLNGSYTDANLTEDTDPVVGGLNGDPLPYVPDWSLGLGIDYEWNVLGDSTAYVGGHLGYTGNRTADFSTRAADGSLREAQSYLSVDLRAGLDRGRWNIEVYGKNLTDKRAVNDIVASGFFPNGAIGLGVSRPRTVGVSFGTKF